MSAPLSPPRRSDVGVRVATAIITVLAAGGVVLYATTTDTLDTARADVQAPQVQPQGGAAGNSAGSSGSSESPGSAQSSASPAPQVVTGSDLLRRFPILPGRRIVENRPGLGAGNRLLVFVAPGSESATVSYYKAALAGFGVTWEPDPPAQPRRGGGNGYRGDIRAGTTVLGNLNVSGLATVYVERPQAGYVTVELEADTTAGR